MLISCRNKTPILAGGVFVADTARIIGDVNIGKNSSVWFQAVIRGDVMPIRIGSETNIQDGSVLHGTFNKAEVSIGDRVTIGHLCMLHGCSIGDETLIGMGSILMDGARIAPRSVVGAGSLVTEGADFSQTPGVLILGRPAKVIRPLTERELQFLPQSAANYLMYKDWYK